MRKQNVTTAELFEAISAFSEQCATKEDLKAFATKEDLQAFATKEDIREVKEDTKKILQLFPSLVHKEDRKVNTLVERLVAKRIFAHAEVADILDAHPLVP